MVADAEVAAIDNSVLGSFPSFLPATALIPNCPPMVGLAATLGTTVIPEPLCEVSGFLCGWKMFRIKSPKSYCLLWLYDGVFDFWARKVSAFNESADALIWA